MKNEESSFISNRSFLHVIKIIQMPHSSSAVAIAAVVHAVYPQLNDPSSVGFGVLPVEIEGPGMFLTEPSLASLASWVTSVVKPSCTLPTNSLSRARVNTIPIPLPVRSLRAAPEIPLSLPLSLPLPLLSPVPAHVPVVLFVPLSVTSLVTKAGTVGMKLDQEKKRLRACCQKNDIAGITMNVRLERS